MLRELAAVILLSCCWRCRAQQSEPAPGLAEQATDVAADTRALSVALAAGNEVVRAAGDCEAVRPLLDTARQRFDEVEPRLRTGAARTSLANLREQVRRVADACP